MKLSEAIRLGAMLRPQCFNVLYDPKTQTSCAIGAAAESVGILDTTRENRFIKGVKAPAEWRGVCRAKVNCPECGWRTTDGEQCITHLNNQHRWTRERIADWVETIESEATSVERKPDVIAVDPVVEPRPSGLRATEGI